MRAKSYLYRTFVLAFFAVAVFGIGLTSRAMHPNSVEAQKGRSGWNAFCTKCNWKAYGSGKPSYRSGEKCPMNSCKSGRVIVSER